MAIYTMGIDIGSTTSKGVILKNGKEIVAKALVQSGTGTDGPKKAMEAMTKESGIVMDKIACVISTGYGRHNVAEADDDMSELSCHAQGAQILFPKTRTVIDIGGQDIKVLSIEDGVMTSFQMNDKCAAGTGRFMEVMANVLGVSVQDLGDLDEQSENEISISSTCTGFAESEVISQLSHGAAIPDIIRGIHRSVADKVVGLVHRVGLRTPLVMTGGVSRNKGVLRALESQLGCDIQTSELSQYAGCIGAAVYAYRRAMR